MDGGTWLLLPHVALVTDLGSWGDSVEGRPFASSCLIFSHSRFNASLNLFFPGRLELVLLFFSWKDESG